MAASLGTVLSDIITLLTNGLSSMATGIGSGLTALVKAIFVTETTGTGGTTTYALSVFGGVVVIFAGISLAVGLSRWVVSWVTSLGANH